MHFTVTLTEGMDVTMSTWLVALISKRHDGCCNGYKSVSRQIGAHASNAMKRRG